jgi:hypothetical protein
MAGAVTARFRTAPPAESKEDETMAKLSEAERVLLRAVLYLLRDSEQRAQVEIPMAGEARKVEITENLRVAEGLLDSIGKLLAK